MASPNEVLAARIAREMTSWTSIEIRVRHEMELYINYTGLPIPKKFPNRYDEHYIETTENMRLFDTRTYSGEEMIARCTGYCDGKRCARVDYENGNPSRQTKYIVSTSFLREGTGNLSSRPAPLQYYYVGMVPLYEALPQAKHLGGLRYLGRDCEKFLFRDQKWAMMIQNIVYTLDKETAIPLKVESYAEAQDAERDLPIWRWSTSEFGRKEGHDLPVDSQLTDYGKRGTPYEGKKLSSHHFRVEAIRYNQDYSRSMFWPAERQPDVLFVDSIAKKAEFPRADPKAPHRLTPETAVAQPIRADTPADNMATISSVMLVLGLAAMLAGALVWWRRR